MEEGLRKHPQQLVGPGKGWGEAGGELAVRHITLQ